MNNPLVSVILPAHNMEQYIALAIDSILNQTYKNIEIIVINDGSTDNTLSILNNFQNNNHNILVHTFEKSVGISTALNKAVELSKGAYLARMDGDDWSYPERIEKQIQFLIANPQVLICGCNIEICDFSLKKIHYRNYWETDDLIRKNIFFYSPFCHPSVIIKKTALLKIGGYNSIFNHAEDYELYFRLGTMGKFANVQQTLFQLRTHKASISQRRGKIQERLTLYIRLKAIVEYKYEISLWAIIFSLLQLASSFLIPSRVKFKLFSVFRARVKSQKSTFKS